MVDKNSEEKYFAHKGLMDLSSYRAEKAILDDEWDSFIEKSNQPNIFTTSAFLKSLSIESGQWNIYKKNQKVGLISVIESDSKNLSFHDLVIYNGIIFGADDPNMNQAQIHSERYRIISFCIDFLTSNYETIMLSTTPYFNDLRPFIWHNYGQNELSRFTLDIRYTSLIKLEESYAEDNLENNDLYMKANKSRRQEIRYGIKENINVSCTSDIDEFLLLYESTFTRQNIEIQESIPDLKSLMEGLHEAKQLKIYASRSSSNELLSMAVFGLYSKNAYYLFGANNPEFRDKSGGSLVIWKAMQDLSSMGFEKLDLEGVNSPARGYFKMSFGGDLLPYYHLKLSQN